MTEVSNSAKNIDSCIWNGFFAYHKRLLLKQGMFASIIAEIRLELPAWARIRGARRICHVQRCAEKFGENNLSTPSRKNRYAAVQTERNLWPNTSAECAAEPTYTTYSTAPYARDYCRTDASTDILAALLYNDDVPEAFQTDLNNVYPCTEAFFAENLGACKWTFLWPSMKRARTRWNTKCAQFDAGNSNSFKDRAYFFLGNEDILFFLTRPGLSQGTQTRKLLIF